MLKPNSDLRKEARTVLSEQWIMAAAASLVYIVLLIGVSAIPIPFVGIAIGLIAFGPLDYGLNIIYYDLTREGKKIQISRLFDGFHDFKRIWGTSILVSVYTYLWSLLLIIPGIIKQYAYAMTPYLLKDEPELKYNAAIEKSMQMMKGHKMKLFLLDLSFLGWFVLCILTLGAGLCFLSPYMYSAHAAFYLELKNQESRQRQQLQESVL